MSEMQLPTLLSEAEYLRLPALEKQTYIKEMLRKTLQLNPHGLTITQMQPKLKFEKRVIEKHLEIMKFTGEVYTVTLGNNVIYIANHKAMHEATSTTMKFGDYEYQLYILKNRFGDFAVIQQRNAMKDSQDIAGAIRLPLEDLPSFVDYLRKAMVDMERRAI